MPAALVIGRIVRSADFERVLAAPTRARSPHFAVHHVADRPSLPGKRVVPSLSTELSTGRGLEGAPPVDDPSAGAPAGLWLGSVIPKRHAKRAVTRNLLKRQIRAAMLRQSQLPGGLWVVRLRAPFDRVQFASAACDALRRAAHDELDALLGDAARRSAARA